TFHGILPVKMPLLHLGAILNSTLTAFFFEVLARAGLGGGAARLLKSDIVTFPVIDAGILSDAQRHKLQAVFNSLSNRHMRGIVEELGFPLCNRRRCTDAEHPYEQVNPKDLTLDRVRRASPDRFELDSVIFDVLGLTDAERLQVYQAVAELVKTRLVRARSIQR
ncbi:MAG: hypothetical protein NZ959_12495, partial [Armatimonadetes bacterium]|nr:hypothetical protein [Armatimonadota bacterium]